MTLQTILPGDSTDLVRSKMNAAIAAIEAETARAEAAEAAETARAQEAETAGSARAKAAETAVQATVGAGAIRPGDTPALFTTMLGGSFADVVPLPASGVAVGAFGNSYDTGSPGVIALRKPIWLEPNAFFALRAVFGRKTNPVLATKSARLAIQWLDGYYNPISQSQVAFYPALLVASGLQVETVRIPSMTDDPCQIVPPLGAAFWRPFVENDASDGVLSILAMTVSDVTDAGMYAPDVSAIAARVTTLESSLFGWTSQS